MSVDKAIRDMVRAEVQAAVTPLVNAIERLQASGDVVARLSAAFGGGGRGRTLKLALAGKRGRRTRGPRGSNDRGCALVGCKRPARSKGYCAAHYQKFRMLARTHRLPADWAEHAAPNSVKDVVLPRGRAGAKALAEARKR